MNEFKDVMRASRAAQVSMVIAVMATVILFVLLTARLLWSPH